MESTIPFSLIILLSSLSLVFSQYVLPDHHFINCGSNSDIDFTGKKFVGDFNPSTFRVSGGTAAEKNNNPPSNTPLIYQTARVFTKKSWYELQADEINTFVMVRLHFLPISSQYFDSKFEVSVSGFNLLSDFIVGNETVKIEEFIIPIRSERIFRIEFTPSAGSSSAFVNAIEAFTTPSDLFTDGVVPLPRISPAGKKGDIEDITSSYAFNPIHRINVGGDMMDETNDTLRRKWVPDDLFIYKNETAITSTPYGQITYRPGGATSTSAPEDVYRTAKQSNGNLVNITWTFGVNRSAMYLVRAHFCDIVSRGAVNSNDGFNFFVYNEHKEPIFPSKRLAWLAAPFYVDMVVDSGDSPFVNISIGAIRGSNQMPFLNGVEIMELLKDSGFVERSNNNNKKNRTTLFIVVGCVIGGVAIGLILFVGFFIGSKYGKVKPVVGAKSESNAVPSYGASSYTSNIIDFTINHPSPIPNLRLNLRIPFVDILHATNNFAENLMIGKGGFGTVYKGTLLNGEVVAVKRGQTGHGQGRPEFVTEITVFARIRHRHLVSLIGYCDEKSEMILVYEFMEKGTLQDHLYNANENQPKLSWNKRLEICIGAAQGLHYLHTGLEGGIIHRDVKSTNILLNKQYVAKVADFGISRLGNEDQSEMSGIKGSFGYLDPEYFKCGTLTQKSDVYSFGIVLLEVLCARAALDHKLPEKEINLAEWAIKQINDGNVEDIIDPYLAGKININSLRKFMSTVGRCLMDTGDERPNMVDVLWDLEYVLKLHQVATDKEPYEDSTINTSMQLPMSVIHRLPSQLNDDSNVNDNSALSYPSESQVFSQLNIDGAR
ncbi:probable receptor-like protein kinase At2g23200 [Cynara cardunculus var. scolymus]|uniref:Concanavalin A-like lectin/glucanase, subgroup n=1 Tax=Cynara cardunculus var. scolymus TaxID=59895 RepID=A0A118JVG4_CYNCS|nr:probable receptor-like protein kinase At2g23200 [Cynara cardunculus var. scolymus]KVH92485.1 Concanavalin A-like lectin/glucanase, subgroup [Cynara cardunculus var. scolymus]